MGFVLFADDILFAVFRVDRNPIDADDNRLGHFVGDDDPFELALWSSSGHVI